jgi:two-component system chemotaxis response regulator CheB
MPGNFMESFAKRLNNQSEFKISLAKDGEALHPGHGYVAPGDKHLVVDKRADVLFKSLSRHLPTSTIAVLMTGMGEDGADGLKSLRDSGGLTLIQDKESSVVWGMAGKADAISAQDETLPLNQIAPAINELVNRLV